VQTPFKQESPPREGFLLYALFVSRCWRGHFAGTMPASAVRRLFAISRSRRSWPSCGCALD